MHPNRWLVPQQSDKKYPSSDSVPENRVWAKSESGILLSTKLVYERQQVLQNPASSIVVEVMLHVIEVVTFVFHVLFLKALRF